MPKTIRTTIDRQPDGSLLVPAETLRDLEEKTFTLTIEPTLPQRSTTIERMKARAMAFPSRNRSVKAIVEQVRDERESWEAENV